MMADTEDVGTGDDLARFLDPTPDPFTRCLLALAAACTPACLRRLREAFPSQVITWEIWCRLDEIPTAGQLRGLVSMVWPPPPVLGLPPAESVAAMVDDYKVGRIALPAGNQL
jgi:hypothetical protein